MDANQTRFHILIGRENWQPLIDRSTSESGDADLVWDDESGCVTLARRLFRFERAPSEIPPSKDDRRGAARDQYGNWYWIGRSNAEIEILPSGLTQPERFWPVDAPHNEVKSGGSFTPLEPAELRPPVHLRGLVVTEEHYLVAGTVDPAGLVIFDLHSGGPPVWLVWPEEVPFAPGDMTPRPGGGLFVLDAAARRYWILDRHFNVVKAGQETVEIEPPHEFAFQPVSGDERAPRPGRRFAAGIELESASPLAVEAPIAIEALPDGTVLILESGQGYAKVHRYMSDQPLGVADITDVFADDEDFSGFDFAFVPRTGAAARVERGASGSGAGDRPGVSGTLYIVGADGNQSFAFGLEADRFQGSESEFALSLTLQVRYLPMRSFGGRALVAVAGADDDEGVFYDREEHGVVRWVPLVEKPRPRYSPAGVLSDVGLPLATDGAGGVGGTGGVGGGDGASGEDRPAFAFDGKERSCVWHRMLLDAVIPAGAEISVESRSADDPSELLAMPWQREPDPYRRPGGAELPFYRPFEGDGAGGREGAGTWETLLQEATGRYLQLRISFKSNGRTTPKLRAVRVYYPRFSYLKEYLPDVYQEDASSASFLERFLANPEGLLTALEDRIANGQFLFDARTTPAEYLGWLAGWLGVTVDPTWEERRKRLLIRHAPQLFAERGTVAGIIRAVRLATDPCPDDTIFTEPIVAWGRAGAHGVRIVEEFLTRKAPGVVFGDPSQVEGPGVTTAHAPWKPGQGPGPLHDRYRAFLTERYGDIAALNDAWGTEYTSFDALEFPPVMPANESEAEDWVLFTRGAIGFTYALVGSEDAEAYRRFLSLRYRRIAALAAADPYYAAQGFASFDDVSLPVRLPPAGPALTDWIQSASIYLPASERAHRFTVLVPVFGEVGAGGAAAGGSPAGKQAVGPDPEVVRRVVELEKPAHTVFEVKPYWAMFRVGEARLGIDTLPGRSSRLGAAVIGQGALGEQYLAYAHPWSVKERQVVGRDRVS